MPIRPARGNISSPFNPARKHPITGNIQPHNGEDIGWGNNGGTNIYAPISGTVEYGWAGGYGNRLIIRTGDTEIWLCHLASTKVHSGTVTEGQHVATMGMTGTATGVHVHWEVRVGGRLVDPAVWVAGGTTPSRATESGNAFFPTREQFKAVQGGYNALGYKLIVDGIEGAATRAAVRDFQAKHGLKVDGIHGPATEAALVAAQPKPAPAPSPAKRASTADFGRVDVVQKALKTKYPLYAGRLTVDNIDGPATIAAVKEFQRRAGLTVDGIAGPATRRALGV